jgi:hypothetical protein
MMSTDRTPVPDSAAVVSRFCCCVAVDSSVAPSLRLFLASSCGTTFVDASATWGFSSALFPVGAVFRSVAFADVDRNGFVDVFVGGWNRSSLFFLNSGTTLTSTADYIQLSTVSKVVTHSVFTDWNTDGRMDLVVCSAADPFFAGCLFYKNNAAGLFRLVLLSSLILVPSSQLVNVSTINVAFGDLDLDGDMVSQWLLRTRAFACDFYSKSNSRLAPSTPHRMPP